MESPNDLIQRWRDRAAKMENGDGAAKLAAYHLRICADELDSIIKQVAANILLDAFAERGAGTSTQCTRASTGPRDLGRRLTAER